MTEKKKFDPNIKTVVDDKEVFKLLADAAVEYKKKELDFYEKTKNELVGKFNLKSNNTMTEKKLIDIAKENGSRPLSDKEIRELESKIDNYTGSVASCGFILGVVMTCIVIYIIQHI